MTAQQKLYEKIGNGFHICVGLDTDINKIPRHLMSEENPVVAFNKIVIDKTYDQAAAYKINFAFYEKYGAKGLENIAETLAYIPQDVIKIADAKRGDIGNTSQMYADSIFNYFNFDAVTLHPYMGHDSVEPFLKNREKLNFILALTSNLGANDFERQKMEDGQYLFQKVIGKVKIWNINKNCGIVFGATNLQELKSNVGSFNDLVVLLPGIGTQGGNLEDVVKVFAENKMNHYLINVSRALIYCNQTENFGDSINLIIKDYNSVIRSLMKEINSF